MIAGLTLSGKVGPQYFLLSWTLASGGALWYRSYAFRSGSVGLQFARARNFVVFIYLIIFLACSFLRPFFHLGSRVTRMLEGTREAQGACLAPSLPGVGRGPLPVFQALRFRDSSPQASSASPTLQ